MSTHYIRLMELLGKERILQDVPLSAYSSFRLGGNADLFFKASSKEDIVCAIANSVKLKIPYFILGSGTNLLISDKGFKGLVIKNETSKIRFVAIRGKRINSEKINQQAQKIYIEADSGVSINRLVRYCLDQGFGGLEFFLGQPGTVGGAIYINAHNIEKNIFIGDKVMGAVLLDKSASVNKVEKKYFHFGYDESILQKTKEIILSVTFELADGSRENLWKQATKVLEYRKKSQPAGVYTSGCTFRNINKSEAIRLATPNFTTSAGYLLEMVGLKGYGVGNAYFSDKHTNFIVHHGNAKASDVLELINIAKKKVKAKYGIDLHEEIVLVGDFQ